MYNIQSHIGEPATLVPQPPPLPSPTLLPHPPPIPIFSHLCEGYCHSRAVDKARIEERVCHRRSMDKEAKANRRRCFMGENCLAHASIQTV